MEFMNVDAKAFVIIDKQRNYSRTIVNQKIEKGELVSRLYMLKAE